MLGMKSVGIKQLKARLSEYVRLARSGESILVTDRDEARLDRLAQGGQVSRAARAASRRRWSPTPLGLPKEFVDRLLDELREDR